MTVHRKLVFESNFQLSYSYVSFQHYYFRFSKNMGGRREEWGQRFEKVRKLEGATNQDSRPHHFS